MTTDRELLELAAKAHGFIDDQSSESDADGLHKNGQGIYYVVHKQGWHNWDPRNNDGENRRLAVKLGISVMQRKDSASAWHAPTNQEFSEEWGDDPCAATRLAVLRCAAAIGKAMP